MRVAPISAALLAAVSLSACGSTVQSSYGANAAAGPAAGSDGLSADGTAPTAAGDGAAAAAGAGNAAGPVAGGGGGVGGAATSGGSAAGSASTPGRATTAGASGSAGGSGGAGGSLGPGVTDKVIQVGVVYVNNGQAANAAIGGGGISSSNDKANADAVIAEINARGGVAGRQLKAVYATYDAQSSETPAAQDEKACNQLTVDNKVLAVFTDGLTDVFPTCMQKAGVLIVSTGKLIAQDQRGLQTFPALIQLGTLVQERMMREMVRSLQRQQYFTGWSSATGSASSATPAKVGVLTLDNPYWTRPLQSVLLPALQAAGYPVAPNDVQRVPMATTTSDAGSQAQAVGSAVLRLRQDGVTHLIILDSSATITLFFSTAAKNQGYRPRLGVNSATGMQALTDAGATGNSDFAGAVGLGWFPNIDLPAAEAVRRQNDQARQCLQIIKQRSGQDLSSGNGASIALAACDGLFFLKAIGDRAGGQLDQAGLVRATEGLGSSFVTALYGKTTFAAGRHDALQTGYDMAWDTGCTCAKYLRSFDIP